MTIGTQVQNGAVLDIAGLDIQDATSSVAPAFVPVYHAAETNSGYTNGRISYTRVLAGVGISPLTTLFDGGGGVNFQLCSDGVTCANVGSANPVTVVTGNTTMSANNDYYCNSTSVCDLTMPATAAVGSTNTVCGINSGGWLIIANTGQSLYYNSSSANLSLADTSPFDCITLTATVANTKFNVKSTSDIIVPATYQDLDTFVGTTGTTLQSHTSNLGHTWAQAPGSYGTSVNLTLNGSGAITNVAGTSTFGYYLSGLTPSSANYKVSATFTPNLGSGYHVALYDRALTASVTLIDFVCDAGASPTCQLIQYVAGTPTTIGTYAFSWSSGASHILTVGAVGTTATAYIDNVPVISGTTAVSAAGQAGIQIGEGTGGTVTATASNWTVQ